MRLQGRTAFGQAPPAEPSQGRENDRRKSAAATGSAGDLEIFGGVAQGVEGWGGLRELIVPRGNAARDAPRHWTQSVGTITPTLLLDVGV
ncbi:hypothetical protein D3C84_927810 [compost metagenome]